MTNSPNNLTLLSCLDNGIDKILDGELLQDQSKPELPLSDQLSIGMFLNY